MLGYEEMKKVFVKFISAEMAAIFFMLMIPFVLESVNTEVADSLGDPAGIGFGWGIIFGGWSIYLPIFYLVLAIIAAYIISIVYRIRYLKMDVESLNEEDHYSFLLILSSIMYAFIPLLLLASLANSQVVIVAVLLGIADVLLRFYCYSKLNNYKQK